MSVNLGQIYWQIKLLEQIATITNCHPGNNSIMTVMLPQG
jgi:hypothetical protein